MKSANTFEMVMAALALVACAACGTPLRLMPDHAVTGGGNDAASADNITQAPNKEELSALKCHTDVISNARLSNCTCSTDNNQRCPNYATNANANGEVWGCTTVAISGGYAYSCECGTARSPNDSTPACGDFYDPANPNATQNSNQPTTTCQTVATSFGYQTSCTCIDTNTAPCDFYQGNSYINDSALYVEVCGSSLNANGATTVCTCNQLLQAAGATCPATFTPSSETVTDLIY